MMLMVTIAAGPDDADDAVEAALQLGLVEFGDPPGEHRQLTGLFAEPQHAHRHGGQASPVSVSASDSLPPWRTRSTICVQIARSLVVAIMSTRMRSVVGQRHRRSPAGRRDCGKTKWCGER